MLKRLATADFKYYCSVEYDIFSFLVPKQTSTIKDNKEVMAVPTAVFIVSEKVYQASPTKSIPVREGSNNKKRRKV